MHHLVLDANAFILNTISSLSPNDELYTIPQIIKSELKDESAKRSLSLLDLRLHVQIPSADSIKFITEFARQTGDLASLSMIDIHLIALTLDLEKSIHKGDLSHLRNAPLPLRLSQGQQNGLQNETSIMDAWIVPSSSGAKNGSDNHGESISMENGVACLSSDFAMQNVLLQIGLGVRSSQSGMCIKSLRHWVLRCHACYAIERDPNRRFCNKCGNATLIRTSIGVSAETGDMVLYLKKNFQFNNRGTIHSIPKKGTINLREDQKEYQRSVKAHQRSIARSQREDASFSLSPFSSFGSTRAGECQQPIIGYGRRNVNASRPTK